LARVLDRDFKRVYEDVKALVDAGLLEQDADGLRAEYKRIETAIAL
jgi:predicted transcriptional regulator